MKAKDLTLGSIVYIPDADNIRQAKVKELKCESNGNITICLSPDPYYDKGHSVKPDAEAITEDKWKNTYFSLKAAQVRQLRIRFDKIESAKQALMNAAEHYSEILAKYKDAPASEPQ